MYTFYLSCIVIFVLSSTKIVIDWCTNNVDKGACTLTEVVRVQWLHTITDSDETGSTS